MIFTVNLFQKKSIEIRGDMVIKWYTPELKRKREQFHFLNEVCKQSSTPHNVWLRNNFRSKYRLALRTARTTAANNFILNSNTPNRSAWKLINSYRRSCTINEDVGIDPKILNHYFTNVADSFTSKPSETNIDPLLNLGRGCNGPRFGFSEVSFNRIRDIIDGLRGSHSRDFYGMTVSLLKTIKNIIIEPLTCLVNECILESVFPDAFKIACVVPVYKKGDRGDPANYRPYLFCLRFRRYSRRF